jgi:cysteinyl-tRNA synthetase
LKATAGLIGLLDDQHGAWADRVSPDLSALETRMAETRAAAMESKDFSEVDRLKAALIEAGLEVRMSKAGVELVPTPQFDAAKLEGLV